MHLIVELIVISAASTISWEIIRYLAPAEIPFRLAPVILILVSFLWTLSFTPSLVMAFAATSGVLVWHKVIGIEGSEPWDILERIKANLRKKKIKREVLSGNITLPPSMGRRLPVSELEDSASGKRL